MRRRVPSRAEAASGCRDAARRRLYGFYLRWHCSVTCRRLAASARTWGPVPLSSASACIVELLCSRRRMVPADVRLTGRHRRNGHRHEGYDAEHSCGAVLTQAFRCDLAPAAYLRMRRARSCALVFRGSVIAFAADFSDRRDQGSTGVNSSTPWRLITGLRDNVIDLCRGSNRTMLHTPQRVVRVVSPLGSVPAARPSPLRRQSRSGSLHVCNVLAAPPRPAASPLPQQQPQPTGKVGGPRTTVQIRPHTALAAHLRLLLRHFAASPCI